MWDLRHQNGREINCKAKCQTTKGWTTTKLGWQDTQDTEETQDTQHTEDAAFECKARSAGYRPDQFLATHTGSVGGHRWTDGRARVNGAAAGKKLIYFHLPSTHSHCDGVFIDGLIISARGLNRHKLAPRLGWGRKKTN